MSQEECITKCAIIVRYVCNEKVNVEKTSSEPFFKILNSELMKIEHYTKNVICCCFGGLQAQIKANMTLSVYTWGDIHVLYLVVCDVTENIIRCNFFLVS